MTTTIVPVHLSKSTNGKPIQLNNSSGANATTLHEAVSGTSSFDEVSLYANNYDTADRTIVLYWGGLTNGEQRTIVVPALTAGFPLHNPKERLNNSLVIQAYSDSGSLVNVAGGVIRITP